LLEFLGDFPVADDDDLRVAARGVQDQDALLPLGRRNGRLRAKR